MILNETYDDIIERLNRYGLNEILSNHFSNSNEELYYVMMDIDYFKKKYN